MPGRQAHGRSLVANPKAKVANKKSKARSQKNALDAFGIAQQRFPTKQKRTPRARELDAEIERKHGRDGGDEVDDDEEEEEEMPQRKKIKMPAQAADGDDAEYGSDSEGNEWQLGGLRDDDEDSEIESDDAFGDSDNEKFEEYSFRGSKSKSRKTEEHDSEDDSEDDEGETLGAEAIDLATALDQFEESSEDEPEEDDDSESEGSADEDSDESDDMEDSEEDDDEEADPDKLQALQGLISEYGGEHDDGKSVSTQKIGLGDLGLSGISDPFMKKSVKLMNKEEKEKRPGATKKLDVPLSRREQGRLDRAAAYEKTNETLDRWTETVKQNRRAEHLVFPLPQQSGMEGLDTAEIRPLTAKNASNELESTIMSIMEASGLSLEAKSKPKPQEFDEEGNLLSRKEALQRKRIERALADREGKRAKRIKKIKSKAYHRVHRKQKERDEMATREAMEEAGEIDSEEEREAQDRRRALERVGQRHKDSKWAKLGNRAKRAVWDDDFRTGLTEMARKDEELRRRKAGKTGGADDSDSDATSSSGDDEDEALHRQLDRLEQDDDEPQSGLMAMKFMQKAEAAKKKANDDMIKQIRRDLNGEEDPGSDEEEAGEVGRRTYGGAAARTFEAALDTSRRASRRDETHSVEQGVPEEHGSATNGPSASWNQHADTPAETAASTAGAWSRGDARRTKKGSSKSRVEDLDLNASIVVVSRPAKSKSRKPAQHDDETSASDSEADQHLPLAIRDQELVARAFAGEDVVGDFEREKAETAVADDDKIIDNTLPGWGSWVGDGVSSREKKRHQGRFLTKIAGVKAKDRKDAKLDKVIINEKRVKKNDQYLATQLPHPFESRQQYERSLRLPVGPEWMTKESFQDGTKPRVLMKQGIIAPISRPTA